MAEKKSTKYKKVVKMQGGGSAGLVYCLGVVGAIVFYLQQAEGFWPSIWAIIKGLIWPAFVIYDVLKHVNL